MIDLLIILILLAIVGGAGAYVHRARKSGKTCIGCPSGGSCSGQCSGCSGHCADRADVDK